MKPPTAIFSLVGEDVILDLDSPRFGDRCIGDIPADDETWEEEERPAIFGCPVAGGELRLRVVCEGVVDDLRGSCGGRKIGEFLEGQFEAMWDGSCLQCRGPGDVCRRQSEASL